MSGLRVVSYGGGVQSTALLVLAAQRRIDFPVFLMANVGEDSEDPDTLPYVRAHAVPYARAHGIDLIVLDRVRRDGSTETLYGRLTNTDLKSVPIPVRMASGVPGNRACTADFKIAVIRRRLREHGATPKNPATLGIGISLDETHRASSRDSRPFEVANYPLLDLDPPLRRQDCERIITDAGLPVPPKSSCWFCPFHKPQRFAEMRRDRPALFDRACDLEAHLNSRLAGWGREPVWLSRFNQPLAQAIPVAGDMLPVFDADLGDGDTCDNGACFT